MTLILQNFRGEVLGGPAQRVRPALNNLREPKISQFHIPINSYKQIFGLLISINHILRMAKLEHHAHLRAVEACLRGLKSSDTSQIGEKLTP